MVSSLEQENERLEKKIGEWYLKNAPRLPPDHTQYARTIQELQNQISAVTSESLAITQRIDSAVISFEDYYNRYEIELSFRKSIDADITGLRSILDGFNGQISKLESELEALEEEILRMKRNNEQAVNALSSQIGTRVSVEVEASPTINLNRTLSGIREEYEKLMERNLGEIEMLFLKRSMSLTSERTSGSVQLESAQVELIDVKHSLQTADIEFQSEKNMISALDVTLVEIQAHYASERAELQRTINIVSEQLGEIRNELESQNEDYQLLVDKKVHLELEIATYQRLLDGPDTNVNEQLSSNNHNEHSNSDEQKDKEHPETRRTRSS
ncbi:keratin, type I cuticular Ha6-like [Hyperolius riggenbachi]|uniref:keratin, type I cuticular Ha6-like n=1 Tax=Hyperolius riggenbachi TaxID=752182 RepID=UPI0035A27864